jgi:hypothetical protein
MVRKGATTDIKTEDGRVLGEVAMPSEFIAYSGSPVVSH